MITAIKNIDMLIEGVLDNGLVFIGEYLEKILQHPIIIADHYGKIFFPEKRNSALIDSLFINIYGLMDKNEYYLLEEDNSLYYRIEVNRKNAYVIVKDLKRESIPQIIPILRESRLAVKCFFSKTNKGSALFKKELTEYLFTPSQANIRDILQLSDTEMDIKRPYYVLLLQTEKGRIKDDPALICAYASEYWQLNNLKAISLYHRHQLAFIIPVNFKDNQAGINLVDNNIDMAAFEKTIENRFKITAMLGLGQIYPLIDLRRSFSEARIAIILNQLMGRSTMIQRFSDLGIYQPIFSQEIQQINEYCSNKLGRLIEHDCKNDGELLPTLRRLLDACVNIKATADSLFIHVNTLYYRMNRIEKILDIDLAKMDTRVELYTAIKVWDTLQILNGENEMLSTAPVPTIALQA